MAITKMSNSGIYGAKYNDMLAGNPYYIPPAFESIASYTASSSETSFTFSSIPQTYKHLQIRTMARVVGTYPGTDNILLRANSDTGNNYNNHTIYSYWNGTAAAMDYYSNNSGLSYIIVTNTAAGGGLPANNYSLGITDIHNYTDTNKIKVFSNYFVLAANSSGCVMGRTSGIWNSTAAVSSITLTNSNGFASNTVVSLYGIKG